MTRRQDASPKRGKFKGFFKDHSSAALALDRQYMTTACIPLLTGR